MKSFLIAAASAAIIMSPAGFALAKGGVESHGKIEIETHVSGNDVSGEASAESAMDNGRGRDHDEDDFVTASSSATSTHKGYWTHPDNAEDVRGREGDSNEHASSTEVRHNRRGRDDSRGGSSVASFFRWIFGLPSSTTVGEIRSAIEASSTASTSAHIETEDDSFFSHIFKFFRFGRRD